MVNTPEIWRELNNASLNDPITGVTNPSITQLRNGDIIVGWNSSNSTGAGSTAGDDVIGARYDWQGIRAPGEFRLNHDRFADNEVNVVLQAVPTGDLLSLYVDRDASSSTIYLDRYSETGVHEAGASIDAEASAGMHGPFDMGVASSTSAVVFYVQNQEETGTQDVIYSRTYNPTTGAVGTETFVIQNGSFSDDILALDATVLTNGNYAVAFQVDNPSGDDEIWVALTNGSGVLQSFDRIPASMGNGILDMEPVVAALPGGEYLVAWTSMTPGGSVIRVQRFDSGGGLMGGAGTLVIGGAALNEPQIAVLPDGSYVIVVDNDTAGQLQAYHVGTGGSVIGDMLVIATGSAVSQPAVVTLADGRVAVTWSDSGLGVVDTAIIDMRDNALSGEYTPNGIHVGTIRNDTFTASTNSLAHGWSGNDRISDGGGIETIRGGTGNDTIIASAVSFGEVFQGDNGTDTLILTSMLNGSTYDGTAGTLTVNGTSQVATSFEIVIGSNAAETLLGRGGVDTLFGGGGNDTIDGRGGVDMLNGDDGNDSMRGGSGNDTVRGQAGNDNARGDGGDDVVFGASGNDRVFGDAGADTVRGDGGDDTVGGGNGNDLLRGGAGDDNMVGNNNNDVMLGDIGLDTLNGGAGNDTLNGGADGDVLVGGTGRDLLLGGAGDDSLTGGVGHDTLTGQAGFDRFIFADDGSDDRITDWQNGTDVIDFSASAQINNFAQFLAAATQTAAGVIVSMADGTSVMIENRFLAQFDAGDFIF